MLLGRVIGTVVPATLVDELSAYAELGIESAIVMPMGEDAAKQVAALGREVIPKIAAL